MLVRPGRSWPTGSSRRVFWVDLSLLTGESVPVEGSRRRGRGCVDQRQRPPGVFVTTVGPTPRSPASSERWNGRKARRRRAAPRRPHLGVCSRRSPSRVSPPWWSYLPGHARRRRAPCRGGAVIACPVRWPTPVAVMAGTGRAAELGVLFKALRSSNARSGTSRCWTRRDDHGRRHDPDGRQKVPPDGRRVVAVAAAAEAGSGTSMGGRSSTAPGSRDRRAAGYRACRDAWSRMRADPVDADPGGAACRMPPDLASESSGSRPRAGRRSVSGATTFSSD